MAIRIAGTAFLKIDGAQVSLRGNLTIQPHDVQREMMAGQDGVHGYKETPVVPYIEADVTPAGITIAQLKAMVAQSVYAQCADGKTYVLTEAVYAGGETINATEGMMKCRWEGVTCRELKA